jgi:hypothetical protein
MKAQPCFLRSVLNLVSKMINFSIPMYAATPLSIMTFHQKLPKTAMRLRHLAFMIELEVRKLLYHSSPLLTIIIPLSLRGNRIHSVCSREIIHRLGDEYLDSRLFWFFSDRRVGYARVNEVSFHR